MSKVMTDIQRSLSELGLSRTEIAIFVVLTQYGPLTVLKISGHADIPRTNIYNHLKSLITKGLVSLIIDNYTKKYQAVEPDQIEEMFLKSRESMIRKTVLALKSIQHTQAESNEISVYRGIDSLKKVYTGLLNSSDKSSYLVKGGNWQKWIEMDREFFGRFEIQRGIAFDSIRCLLNPSPKTRGFVPTVNSNNMRVKVLPVQHGITTNMILVDGVLVVHRIEAPFECIVIKNHFLYTQELQEFELIWGLL
jgi:predicted transcriptional regulator